MDEAARLSPRENRGGRITFPFIIGTMACLTLASGGWAANLIVYLIEEFNIKSISAAKIFNFVVGSYTMFPIVGAVLADSYVGCFFIIWFSSLVSLLGVLLLVLTVAISHLRPPPCEKGSNSCQYPSQVQFAVLYLGLALASLGIAGTRFTIATMGADQFDERKQQGNFFSWYFFTMYFATVVSSTAIVYIEDNVSWTLGFTICFGANVLGLLVLLCGRRFYRLAKPRGSPFMSLVRVVVAATSKRRMILSEKVEDFYHQDSTKAKNPSHFFSKFLNRAALRNEGDKDGSDWKVCTVEQVEDLKSLIKIFPLWTTGLLLRTPLAIQISLTVVQALAMDRRLNSHFNVPAGSMSVFLMISTSIFIFITNNLFFPLWEKLTKRPITLLQRVGIGHVITIISMAVSAIVESKRLKIARENPNRIVVPISAMWLVPQLVIAGMGEAFHFPGQTALYYQEFPESLKSTASAALPMFIGIAFYTSNAIIDLLRSITGWLPDNINQGRLDNLYWLCCILGGLNFSYYLVCASMYKYQQND